MHRRETWQQLPAFGFQRVSSESEIYLVHQRVAFVTLVQRFIGNSSLSLFIALCIVHSCIEHRALSEPDYDAKWSLSRLSFACPVTDMSDAPPDLRSTVAAEPRRMKPATLLWKSGISSALASGS